MTSRLGEWAFVAACAALIGVCLLIGMAGGVGILEW